MTKFFKKVEAAQALYQSEAARIRKIEDVIERSRQRRQNNRNYQEFMDKLVNNILTA